MKKVKVGYLGEGSSSFGFSAMTKAFGKDNTICPDKGSNPVSFKSHDQICQGVGTLHVKFGIVAIENSIDGIVNDTIRSIAKTAAHYGLAVCGETAISINMFYMRRALTEDRPVKVVSHRTALNQCRTFVDSLQRDGIRVELCESTEEAAKQASLDPKTAALASLKAAENHGLKLIRQESVTDYKSITRFWILGKHHAPKLPERKYKTCFLVNLDQSSHGVLHKTLGVFAENDISVLLVYPIPIIGKVWEYTFLIEVKGHISDEGLVKAWDRFCVLGISLQPLKFLGSYVDTATDV